MTLSRKIIIAFTVVGLGALLIWLGPGFYNDYKNWQFTKKMNKIAEELDRAGKEEYQAMMADTYGGKTPQETLKLYIAAVEKGDYELASKYFVVEKQGEWQSNLLKLASASKLENLLAPLRSVDASAGYYSSDKNIYSIDKPVFIEFILSLNGVWKILQM